MHCTRTKLFNIHDFKISRGRMPPGSPTVAAHVRCTGQEICWIRPCCLLQKLRCLQHYLTINLSIQKQPTSALFSPYAVIVFEFAYHFIETSAASYNLPSPPGLLQLPLRRFRYSLQMVVENHMMLSRLAFLCCSNLNCAINIDIHSYLRF